MLLAKLSKDNDWFREGNVGEVKKRLYIHAHTHMGIYKMYIICSDI